MFYLHNELKNEVSMEAKNPDITEQDMHFMELAAKIAEENIDRGGGPFGGSSQWRSGCHRGKFGHTDQ